jgi:hypothetical protein
MLWNPVQQFTSLWEGRGCRYHVIQSIFVDSIFVDSLGMVNTHTQEAGPGGGIISESQDQCFISTTTLR